MNPVQAPVRPAEERVLWVKIGDFLKIIHSIYKVFRG